MPLWARYLRKVHLEFSPLSATSSSLGFLGFITTPKIREAVPKLQVSTKRLTQCAEGVPLQTLALTFVDGNEAILDISSVQIREILAEIEMHNGRLEMEAMKRGKPWA
uniref:Uncharacterized protein n=1 Tax=Coccolithus braarudii TaxID=221442 RepID=A0A7S0Q5Y3_9EUKA|mmetsp:Transcript_38204/g.81448  ORF Transcript_38204/g.81448 Transcript_38204/m.81448 type:complete len:108 (+) Transcript_38204:134-457(+)|eukprot:CAMPEP_0183331412 /NCGR_PEP_ID=MMETSP0164_2-20130417/765_1 /TAXON_ID=221442 /ORGANISM="Coccolithus pelagicus ssp braarudi, Strain PLY182g" /LENGTH=107 /DNA_ID=CAMNT_0025499873 /DNA_START=119 /DNA_END=442 /DNA_ORIENTATION=+